MLRQTEENQTDERDEVELSRRSFFGRLAVGAVLSIAMPGAVHAAKSKVIKADKNHRLAQSSRTAVRLPKHAAAQKTKATRHASHTTGKPQKAHTGKTVSNNRKSASGNLHTAHLDHHNPHSARVRDVYNGKKQTLSSTAGHNHLSHSQDGRVHSIIQPGHHGPIIQPDQQHPFLADRGHFSTHRALAFQNPHTGDKLNLTYFEKGRYLSDALHEISFMLRDHRTDDVHPIDPELLDQLHDLKQMLGLHQPFDVICGYRSPLTNAKLHAEHTGVANNSFHMHGRAVDIRIERFDLRRIHNAALAMHRGGVGYYPESNFIHLDTGTFRTWSL